MNRIKLLRESANLSQVQLASVLKVNPATIVRWEKTGNIPLSKAADVAKALNCTISDVTGDEQKEKTIGQRIKIVRGEFHLTVTELAKKLEVTQAVVSHWENTNKVPDRSLKAIAAKCNVSFEWLKTGEGSMFIENKSSPKLGTPKDLAVIYGFDHRTAEAIERYAQLPAEKRLEFSETLAYVMLGRPAVGTAKINASYEIAENVATIKKALVRHDAHHADLSETKADAEVKLSTEEIETIENTEANAESEELAEIQKDKPR